MTAHARDVRRVRHLRLPRRAPRATLGRRARARPDAWSPTSTRRAAGSATTPTSPGPTGSPGRWVDVDPLLVAAVEVAVAAAAAQTGGLVNPLLGRPLVQLGYDRDLARCGTSTDDADRPARPRTRPRRLARDRPRPDGRHPHPRRHRARPRRRRRRPGRPTWSRPRARAASSASRRGQPRRGRAGRRTATARPWPVAVSEHPGDARDRAVRRLDRGGLATSSTQVRRWTPAGVRRHHLLDPRTGRPAPEVWRTVTATGPTCVAANTASTAAVVLGAGAPAWLARARRDRPPGRGRRRGPPPSAAGRPNAGPRERLA